MRISTGRPATAAALLIIAGMAGVAEARAQDLEWLARNVHWEWQGTVESGDAVTIRNVNGAVIARGTDASQVRIRATKEGEDDDPDEVEIEIVEDARGVLVCAVYPARRGGDRNRCGRRGGYRMNVRNHDVKVHFVVEVPSDVRLDANTVNGDIEARGLAERVEAETVNGGIEVETAGRVTAETVNGDIAARFGPGFAEAASFETVNGGIRVVLPEGTDADVDIQTVNGAIDTDFPLTIRGRWGPKSASGEIGDGGPDLKLETVNGSITLVRGT